MFSSPFTLGSPLSAVIDWLPATMTGYSGCVTSSSRPGRKRRSQTTGTAPTASSSHG